MSDIQEEGTWRWGTETTDPDFTNWAPGEPNNSNVDENCGVIDKTGEWNDGACRTALHYICEKAQDE